MQYTANTTRPYDRRIAFQRKLEAFAEWSDRPLSGFAQCAVTAAGAAIMFIVFFAIYMMTA